MATNLWTAFFAWLQRLVGEPARSFFYPLNVSNIPTEGINVSFGGTEVCNITAFNQSSSIPLTLTTRDDKGNSKQYTISPNAPLEVQLAQVASFTVTGTGGSILAYFTWPETIPASTTVINGPVTITGNVGRTWTLGASDVPGRGWNLDSSDVPNRSWNLGSGDVPGRGWNLGNADRPNRSWALTASDILTVYGSEGVALQTDSAGNTKIVPQSLITLLPPSISNTDSVAPVLTAPSITATAGAGSSSSVTSLSVSLSVTAGQLIGVGVRGEYYAATISDSASNSYTELLGTTGTYYTAFWYATATTSGTITITAAFSAANYCSMTAFAADAGGIGVTSPSWASGDSTAPAANATPDVTIVPSMAVGLIGNEGADISDPTGSALTWTIIGSQEGSVAIIALFQASIPAEQTVAFSATLSTSADWDAAILTLSPDNTPPQILTLSVTAGDAIIVAAEMLTGTVSSVTDSQGNSYTLQLAAVGGLNVYNGTASTTETLTITVDFNGICQEVVALDVAAPNGNPTVRINTTSTPLPPIPGTPTMIIAITNTESDLNTNTAILFSENGLYIGISPTAGTATPVLTAVTKQDVVLSYSGTASTIHSGG